MPDQNADTLSESDQKVILHYLDKVIGMQVEAGKRSTQSTLFCLLGSLTLLSASFGGISIDDKFSALGVSLQVHTAGLLLVGAWTVALLLLQMIVFGAHETRLRNIVLRLYKRCGLNDMDAQDEYSNPLEYPNILALLTDSRTGVPNYLTGWLLWLLAGALALLPAASVILAYVRAEHLVGHPWWWIASLLLNIAALVTAFLIAFN